MQKYYSKEENITMAATYRQDEKLAKIADKVIGNHDNLHHLKDERCRIAYLYSDEAKKSRGKTVFADTEKVKAKLKAIAQYDFAVTFYEPNTVNLNEETMERLMYHELRHIGFDPKDGRLTIIPHEIEDFRDIVDNWGIDWISSKP